MSAADSPCHEADDGRFTRHDESADPPTVARIRDEFSRWLRGGAGFDEHRSCDVILAVSEALSNTAEFAYADGDDGTVDVVAVRDVVRHTLTVTISDRGQWRETNPLHRQRGRGRGIPLMRTHCSRLERLRPSFQEPATSVGKPSDQCFRFAGESRDRLGT